MRASAFHGLGSVAGIVSVAPKARASSSLEGSRVHRHDPRRPRQPRALDGIQAHAARADHHDRLAGAHAGGVDHRAGRPVGNAAGEQAAGFGRHPLAQGRDLALVVRPPFSAKAPHSIAAWTGAPAASVSFGWPLAFAPQNKRAARPRNRGRSRRRRMRVISTRSPKARLARPSPSAVIAPPPREGRSTRAAAPPHGPSR